MISGRTCGHCILKNKPSSSKLELSSLLEDVCIIPPLETVVNMDDADSRTPQLPSFADRLNYLWGTRLSPRGTPYTLREVHEGTGRKLSISYLSLLRKGGVAEPSGEKLQALANFFGVPITYFTAEQVPQELAVTDLDPELLEALRNPMVREIALRAKNMGREEWELVLHMMHHARDLVGRIKPESRAGSESPDASPPDKVEE